MRPVLNRQSALKAPLNEILGREANVRILRALSGTDEPVSPSRLAELTELHISGIARTVALLEDHGIVETVGVGTRRPVQYRRTHPLAPAIEALFQAERARFNTIVDRLTDAARRTAPPPRAAWIQGPVLEDRDGPGDPLIVGLLGGVRDLEATVSGYEEALGDLELEQDVTIEIKARTEADLSAGTDEELAALRRVLPLLGPPPLAIISADAGAAPATKRQSYTHAELDARARDLAGAIALRLQSDPSLVARARTHIAERLTSAAAGERRELREWDRILRTMSLPRLRRFLVDTGQRATRLRQTLPFTGILSPEERDEIIAAHQGGEHSRRP